MDYGNLYNAEFQKNKLSTASLDHKFELTIHQAKRTKVLLFGEKIRKSDGIFHARVKRQFAEVTSLVALGMGIYNQYEITQIQNTMAVDHSRIANLEDEFGVFKSSVFTAVMQMNLQQKERSFLSQLKKYNGFWREAEQVFLAANAGNLLPTFTSSFFNMTNAVEAIKVKAVGRQCVIRSTELELLSYPVTVTRESGSFQVIVGVPCVSIWSNLYEWNRHQRLYDPKQKTLWRIATAERYFVKSVQPLVNDQNQPQVYGAMEGAQLQLCQTIGGTWFCPREQVMEKRVWMTCMGALWSSNHTAIREQCPLEEEKSRTDFVRVAVNSYRFFKKQNITVQCFNRTSVYEDGKMDVTLKPGCKLETAEVLIEHLEEQSITQNAHIVELVNFDPTVAVDYQGFMDKMSAWHAKHAPALIWSNNFVTFALVAGAIAFAVFLWWQRRKHMRKRQERQARYVQDKESNQFTVEINNAPEDRPKRISRKVSTE
jgi:hypothetical protein